MDIQQIFANNRKWIESKLSADSKYFKKLAEGQNPRIQIGRAHV